MSIVIETCCRCQKPGRWCLWQVGPDRIEGFWCFACHQKVEAQNMSDAQPVAEPAAHLDRLQAMLEPAQQTWDLSPQDVAAIAWAVAEIKRLRGRVVILEAQALLRK